MISFRYQLAILAICFLLSVIFETADCNERPSHPIGLSWSEEYRRLAEKKKEKIAKGKEDDGDDDAEVSDGDIKKLRKALQKLEDYRIANFKVPGDCNEKGQCIKMLIRPLPITSKPIKELTTKELAKLLLEISDRIGSIKCK